MVAAAAGSINFRWDNNNNNNNNNNNQDNVYGAVIMAEQLASKSVLSFSNYRLRKFGNRRTDGPMPIACLAWRVKSLVLLLTRDLSLTLGVSPSTIQCNSQSQYR